MTSTERKALRWIVGRDTGTSSQTIWAVMHGVRARYADVPYDPSDFGRCYRLLKLIPSWRKRLPEVARKHKNWRPLVDAWDELTALYEAELRREDGMAPRTYARMRQLRGVD